jgi:protein TonB
MNDPSPLWYSYRKTLVFSFLFAFCFHAAFFVFVRNFPTFGKLKSRVSPTLRVLLRHHSSVPHVADDIRQKKPAHFFPKVSRPRKKKPLPQKVKKSRPKTVKRVKKTLRPVERKKPVPEPPRESPKTDDVQITQPVKPPVPGMDLPQASISASKPEENASRTAAARQREVAYPDYEKSPELSYPPLAQQRGFQGKVMLKIMVSKEGRALRVVLVKSSGHTVLDRAAVKAVREWVFNPGKLNGVPIDMWVMVPVVYRLK